MLQSYQMFHHAEQSVRLYHEGMFYTWFLLILFLCIAQERNNRIGRFWGLGLERVGLGLFLLKIVLQGISARGCFVSVQHSHSDQSTL